MSNVGMCIYCGNHESPLTREHILPQGLGGNRAPEGHSDAFVLQNASCESCRRITQKIEEQCLISMMGPGRAKLGLKRKDRAKSTTSARIKRLNGTEERCELDWSQVPGPIAIPSFYEAGVLTNKPMERAVPCDCRLIVVALATRQVNENVAQVGVSLSINYEVFAQMLAKIALGVAVAVLGPKGFQPLVREFILKKPHEYGHWVGGVAGNMRAEQKTSELHSVTLRKPDGPFAPFIIVEIRLFAKFGGPSNYVVVGRRL